MPEILLVAILMLFFMASYYKEFRSFQSGNHELLIGHSKEMRSLVYKYAGRIFKTQLSCSFMVFTMLCVVGIIGLIYGAPSKTITQIAYGKQLVIYVLVPTIFFNTATFIYNHKFRHHIVRHGNMQNTQDQNAHLDKISNYGRLTIASVLLGQLSLCGLMIFYLLTR
ncbi:hypothetical protein HCY52_08010 [Acinetobacter radioresistens]|uniref:hypothetical protein n=1 Tax=Acinetobacter radioresistens TaxID=40216 RepID=UPI0020064DFF|nr:hypothetical protein [Acinetobacter radioresistens]MCK4083759.1 hypothetical protein [Acinetobacter radioresistens]